MHIFLLLSLFVFNSAWADIGLVIKKEGANDAYLMRGKTKHHIYPEMVLKLNDAIYSKNTKLVIYIHPSTQIILDENTDIKLTQPLVINFVKGIIRVQVVKEQNQIIDQKVQADGVAFIVKGTEFEVSQENGQGTNLDVVKGEVEVSSPYVHTFVPEIIKSNQGFRYLKYKKSFDQKSFAPKFLKHPGFEDIKNIKARYRILKNRDKGPRK